MMCRSILIAVVGLFAASFLVTALAKARVEAASSRSKDNLRTIYQGMDGHVSAYGFFPGNGAPPPEAVTTPDCRTKYPDSEWYRWGYGDPKRAGRHQTGSCLYAILPYIGEEKAFRTQDHSRAVPVYYIGTRRPAVPQTTPKELDIYPKWAQQDAGLGPTGRSDYAANTQVIRSGFNQMKPDEISDGLGETFIVAEKAMDTRSVKVGYWQWDQPIILGITFGTGRVGNKLIQDSDKVDHDARDHWGSPDPEGVWFLFADGHTRKLPYRTPPKVISAMLTPTAGDTVDLD
ncbi:DUF1559 domain-containing protein [Zavarzinella formosa]|uniref:DUF1559 domain-containing protein n=1 Tax=Zavarzinella formosa TaxID=360055 RepID=UPI0002EB5DDC|nr:DUF1559 domain-containing protein [Zavarzinella formosa]